MRRKDREMDRSFGLTVIDRSRFGILAMVDRGRPYAIPLSLVREGDALYFHSAPEGRKTEVFQQNPEVSIAFVGEWRVPELFTAAELEKVTDDEEKTAILLSKVFTVEFESVVATGRVRLVRDDEERIKAMRLICEKYTPTKMAYFTQAAQAGLPRTHIYRIDMTEVKAKRKKYDRQGEEMKWGQLTD